MPDGSYDLSFGDNGVFRGDLPGFNDGPISVAIQSVGGEEKIVVTTDPNQTGDNNYDLAVLRLSADGTLDTTFGEDADSHGTPDGFIITDPFVVAQDRNNRPGSTH